MHSAAAFQSDIDAAMAAGAADYLVKPEGWASLCQTVNALLHHPAYRTRYAANLKRELPRLPYAPDFHAFAQAGERLADRAGHHRQP